MPKRRLAVRPEGQWLNKDATERTQEEQTELAGVMADSLTAAGCCPVGTKESQTEGGRPVLDPEWGSDLGELIARSVPHERYVNGQLVTVSVKLDTLEVEVDRDGEVCAWLYTED